MSKEYNKFIDERNKLIEEIKSNSPITTRLNSFKNFILLERDYYENESTYYDHDEAVNEGRVSALENILEYFGYLISD